MIGIYLLCIVKGVLWTAVEQFIRYVTPQWNWDSLILRLTVSIATFLVVSACIPTPAGIIPLVLIVLSTLLSAHYIPWHKIFK